MTNDEINRYIHTQIMGKCWHEELNTLSCCLKCGQVPDFHTNIDGRFNPDYCSDKSPRSLLNDVQRIVEPHHLAAAFYQIPNQTGPFVAEQIARACVEAHKAADPPPQAEGQGEEGKDA